MEWVLSASIAALLECENVSILALPRMLVDERYRLWVLRQVKDPIVRRVWDLELGKSMTSVFGMRRSRFLSRTRSVNNVDRSPAPKYLGVRSEAVLMPAS